VRLNSKTKRTLLAQSTTTESGLLLPNITSLSTPAEPVQACLLGCRGLLGWSRTRDRDTEKAHGHCPPQGGGERERSLLGTIHNGGSRASPAHGLRITTLRSSSPHTLDGVSAYMSKTFPGLSSVYSENHATGTTKPNKGRHIEREFRESSVY
jgi:hypothetical protein